MKTPTVVQTPKPPRNLVATLTVVFMTLVVVLAGIGFTFKIYMFFRDMIRTGELSFAVIPVAAYVCTALGFALLLVWSFLNGQFRDLEGPKFEMLRDEERLQAEENGQALG